MLGAIVGDIIGSAHEYTATKTKAFPLFVARMREPYQSFGNGSAMRVSPVGFAFDTMEDVLEWAERSAAVTHNHPQGIRGAQDGRGDPPRAPGQGPGRDPGGDRGALWI